MQPPLIGLTAYKFHNSSGLPQSGLGEAYTRAVAHAGGLPVIIPLGLPEAQLIRLAQRLDGVLFTGGGDIDPARYGHAAHPLVDDVDAERDRTEFVLLDHLLKQQTPILGICRGFQVINTGLGGTLFEDILDQKPGALRHQYYPNYPRDLTPHTVEVTPGSRLAEILGQGGPLPVNSLHHQGVEDPAPGLVTCAVAPDGLIEALEQPDHPFLVAVQWHPECLPDHAPMQAIFRAFVAAAGR
jgi:putative glutamine amidotransferase